MPRFSTAECGTNAGYQRHRKLAEPPCGPCDQAHKDTSRRNHGNDEPRFCACGTRIKTQGDTCWRCRENRPNPNIHTDDELAYHGGWIRQGQILAPDTPGRTR